MKSILLIGLGLLGKHIAVHLNELGHEVMAVDSNEERVNEVMPFVTSAQIGDSTNAEFLRSLGIGNYDICIVTISDNFQDSLETTSLLKELGAKCVVSRAERDVQEKFLLRNGADHVVYPEKQIAKWTAMRYTTDHIFDYIEIDRQHAIFEVEIPESWVGKSIGELLPFALREPQPRTQLRLRQRAIGVLPHKGVDPLLERIQLFLFHIFLFFRFYDLLPCTAFSKKSAVRSNTRSLTPSSSGSRCPASGRITVSQSALATCARSSSALFGSAVWSRAPWTIRSGARTLPSSLRAAAITSIISWTETSGMRR